MHSCKFNLQALTCLPQYLDGLRCESFDRWGLGSQLFSFLGSRFLSVFLGSEPAKEHGAGNMSDSMSKNPVLLSWLKSI